MRFFDDVFIAGFECSTHRLEDGRRLDLTASTRHDRFADEDYRRLASVGVRAARDGIAWVKAEKPWSFDFSFALPLVRAAARHNVAVAWDLMHFGWPDDVDIFAPSFPLRYGRYVRAFARWIADVTEGEFLFVPINEMSFFAWAGGDVSVLNPFVAARGVELKAQLVRAAIEGIEAIREVLPHSRFLQPEPAIHIHANPRHPKTHRRVDSDNILQFQAWDMLTGRVWPLLGGHPKYLDIIGVNFYSDNQFTPEGDTVARSDDRYRPLSKLLLEVHRRYERPMIISETGAEGDQRAPWLRYVCEQAAIAIDEGCDLRGITLYPILNHPGWGDDRHCQNGLWDYPNDRGERAMYQPLFEEMARQRPRLLQARERRRQR